MHTRLRSSSLLVALSLLLAVAGGCESTGSGSNDGKTPVTPTGSLRAGIPPKANVVVDTGTELTWTATGPGRAFLYNASKDRTVGRYHLKQGQTFIVAAGTGRATIDGNEVLTSDAITRDDLFKLYFLPE